VELIELVIEASDHVLDLGALFVGLQFLKDGGFNVSGVKLDCLEVLEDVLLLEDVEDGGCFTLLDELEVFVVNYLQSEFVYGCGSLTWLNEIWGLIWQGLGASCIGTTNLRVAIHLIALLALNIVMFLQWHLHVDVVDWVI
jgi:hypothetical protein